MEILVGTSVVPPSEGEHRAALQVTELDGSPFLHCWQTNSH